MVHVLDVEDEGDFDIRSGVAAVADGGGSGVFEEAYKSVSVEGALGEQLTWCARFDGASCQRRAVFAAFEVTAMVLQEEVQANVNRFGGIWGGGGVFSHLAYLDNANPLNIQSFGPLVLWSGRR